MHRLIAVALALFFALGTTMAAAQSAPLTLPETMAYSMFLIPGLNLTSVPAQGSSTWTLETLCRQTGSSFVIYEEGGTFKIYQPGVEGFSNDQAINPAKGYIVRSLKSLTKAVTVTGAPWPEDSLTVRLHPGANLIAFPRSVPPEYMASNFFAATSPSGRGLGEGTMIRTLRDPQGRSRFEAYIPGIPATDFPLEHGKGYLVLSPAWVTVVLPERSRRLTNGTGIVFTMKDEPPFGWHIYTMGNEGANRKRIGRFSSFDVDPEYSPDGQVLAFSSFAGCSSGTVGTFLTNGTDEGENLVRLSGALEFSNGTSFCQSIQARGQAFHISGKTIFRYGSGVGNTSTEMGGMPRDASVDGRTKVIDDSNKTWPGPSKLYPDVIYYLSDLEGSRKIFKAAIVEQFKPAPPATKISDLPITGDGLSVSPLRDMLLVTSGRDIVSVDPTTATTVNMTISPADEEASEAAWSPDGSRFVYRVRNIFLDEWEIRIRNADGTGQTTVAAFGSTEVSQPKFRP